eukprot:scaffold14370_cov72-Phaeocystis_antarctica.AAC.2
MRRIGWSRARIRGARRRRRAAPAQPPAEFSAHTEFVGVEKARTHSHDATHVAHQTQGHSEARVYAQLQVATLRLAALCTLATPCTLATFCTLATLATTRQTALWRFWRAVRAHPTCSTLQGGLGGHDYAQGECQGGLTGNAKP